MNILGHDIDHLLGDIVTLVTDKDKFERMVTEIALLPEGLVKYQLSFETVDTDHYSMEIDKKNERAFP